MQLIAIPGRSADPPAMGEKQRGREAKRKRRKKGEIMAFNEYSSD
jgi:hypothetical protein